MEKIAKLILTFVVSLLALCVGIAGGLVLRDTLIGVLGPSGFVTVAGLGVIVAFLVMVVRSLNRETS